jgi:hypothetical protein
LPTAQCGIVSKDVGARWGEHVALLVLTELSCVKAVWTTLRTGTGSSLESSRLILSM